MKFESIVKHYEYAPSMRKEQQGDNKTREIRIIVFSISTRVSANKNENPVRFPSLGESAECYKFFTFMSLAWEQILLA